jgi:transposase
MPQNFIESNRDQSFLLPPSLRDWLPEDHLAWFVIEAVDELDLAAFFSAYRADGLGRAAYDPAVMVALVLYAFSIGERSARAIEAHCRQDVAFRVICGNLTPDHATIARFLRRHEQALCGLFGSVLGLCERAGLVGSGLVAMDGTKVSGSANRDRNLDYDQIAREIIADAIATDEAEDELYGDRRGDELPEQLRTHEGRREWLRRELGRDRGTNETGHEGGEGGEFDADRIVDRIQGRQGWTREARRHLEADPWQPPTIPGGTVNLTDPDTKLMKGMRNYIQGYNAQAVVNDRQIVLAAEITNGRSDPPSEVPPRSTEMVPERLEHSYPGPAGECEHGKSEALPVERLQWLVLAEVRDLVRRGERELVPGYGALPLFD